MFSRKFPMITRLKIISISLMVFIPIFLGILFQFSSQLNYLDNSDRLLAYTLSLSLIESIVIGVFLYTRKRIINHPGYSRTNEDIDIFKKHWWAYLSIFILIPTVVFYLINVSGDYSDILNYIISVFVGVFFIIYKPISNKGIFSRKLELILGGSMFICGFLLVLLEIFFKT
jgi:hypothetical protein